MTVLSTITPPSPPSFVFSKLPAKLHHHFSTSFSSTPFRSLSSTCPSSRTFFSSRNFSITSDDDNNDEWGNEAKSKSKSKPKPKPKSKPTSFTVGPPELNVSVTIPDEWGEKSGPEPEPDVDDEWGKEPDSKLPPSTETSSITVGAPDLNISVTVPDEWGDKSGPEPEPEPETETKSIFVGGDPPIREDEDAWGPTPPTIDGDGGEKESKNLELKRALLDSLYGSELGFRASAEVRAEVSELVNQLESANPYPNPTDEPGLLDGNWVLVYTAFSELLPLLAVGSLPLLKVEQISQAINTMSQTVENSTTISSPFATFSFSATASFDVRSSSRIQVRFNEATFKPPEIKSRFDLPDNINVFGQNIALSPVQQLLNPVQEAAAGISRALYGLPPLKIPIPGERAASWLLFTYVDEDFRISRGDGGIFVLVREGSPLLDL